MFRNAKLEVYIIFAALIIASLIIGLFWFFNREETPTYVYNHASPVNVTLKYDDADKKIPIDIESKSGKTNPDPVVPQISLTKQGLAKLTVPTTVKALVLGDSVAGSQGDSNNVELGWHSLVSKDLQSKYPGNFQWVFNTIPNATVNDVLTHFHAVTTDTDLIILCLGRNDWAMLTTKVFKQKYKQLLDELKVSNPSATIFLVVEPPVKNTENNNKSFPYRQVIIELGKQEQLPVIDEWSAFIKDPTPLAKLLEDGVNPNHQGYRVFADEVTKGVAGFLSGNLES